MRSVAHVCALVLTVPLGHTNSLTKALDNTWGVGLIDSEGFEPMAGQQNEAGSMLALRHDTDAVTARQWL